MKQASFATRFAIFAALALMTFSAFNHAFSRRHNRHASHSRSHWNHQTRGHRLPKAARDKDFYEHGAPSKEKVNLGNLLFFDKILSGNENISCATCHHPFGGTGDGFSLGIGEGARGISVTRDTGSGADAVHGRIPRNAPAIFNLGAKEFVFMFHDGRVTSDPSEPSGFRSPAGSELPSGLDNPIAVQAMIPPTASAEMAGQSGESPVGDAAAAGNLSGPGGVWEQLAQRLQAIPEYVDLFVNAFPDINVATDITFVHAANAIAAFEAAQWRADNSPFDRYLRGERDTMSDEAIAGMNLFYGAAKCADCHSGTFQTDQSFHALAMPQIGPGKGNGPSGHEDFGRYNETGDPDDMFKFRTPSLRNTQLTGPWSHSGAYNSLEAVIRHHLDPIDALNNYDRAHAVLPSRPDLDALDFIVQDDPVLRAAIAAANELDLPHLNDKKVQDLIAFIGALTDPASLDLRIAIPKSVPSGLPIFD